MANRERGEIAVTTFDGVEYTIAPYFNALCAVQEKFGAKLKEIVRLSEEEDDPLAIRACVWVLLQRHHKEQFQTFEAVGDWLDAVPGGAGRVLRESWAAQREAGAAPPNPPNAQTGIGEPSLSALAALA